jgi:transposase
MKAYSMDLRERIVSARRSGEDVESVAQRFGVCTKTVRTYEKRAALGCLWPTPRKGKARRLSEAAHVQLGALVQERSNWTLASLAQEWQDRGGEVLPSSTLHDALVRLKITHKKRVSSPANDVSLNEPPFA